MAVAVDSSNKVYATTGGTEVEKFTSEGNLITTWGASDIAPGWANGVAVSAKGEVYVSDPGQSRVIMFVPVPASAPVVATDPASAVSVDGATLNATVNPENQAGNYYVRYGPSTTAIRTPPCRWMARAARC
jgi:hypothetical protein